MNIKKPVKVIIGSILDIVSFCIIIGAAIASIVFQFQNPDMSEIRCFIENPGPSIATVFALILLWIGNYLIKK